MKLVHLLTVSLIVGLLSVLGNCDRNQKPAKLSGDPDVTFTNPVLKKGADPWVYKHSDGYYYLMVTRGDRLMLWRSRQLSQIGSGKSKVIWCPPEQGPNSRAIWAPEIYHINGKWYVYYTAADKDNYGDQSRYVFVLENSSEDPFTGSWQDRSRIKTKYTGLDGSVFNYGGQYYYLYSAYINGPSVLVIAKMINPWTLEGEEVIIARPEYEWEKFADRQICEAPQFLRGPEDKSFIIYSASACWDDNYALGMLVTTSDDLLNPDSWKKLPDPVFGTSVQNGVYGPGHCSFTTSPDGTENWIVYHAKAVANGKCRNRSTRVQPFGWTEDGFPDFGVPVSIEEPVHRPSGELEAK